MPHDTNTELELIKKDIRNIFDKLDDLIDVLKDRYADKGQVKVLETRLKQLEKLNYGMLGLVLTAVVAQIINLVVL